MSTLTSHMAAAVPGKGQTASTLQLGEQSAGGPTHEAQSQTVCMEGPLNTL